MPVTVDQDGQVLDERRLLCARELGRGYEQITPAVYNTWRAIRYMTMYGASRATVFNYAKRTFG